MSSLNSVCYSGRRRLRLAAPLKLREKMDTSPALSVSAQPSLAAWKSRIKQWSTSDMESHEERVLLILTLIIGALVGLVVAAFIYVTENLAARMYPAGGAVLARAGDSHGRSAAHRLPALALFSQRAWQRDSAD